MSRILVIESSARQQGSVSRQLTADFIAQWQAAHPQDEVKVRDLAKLGRIMDTLVAQGANELNGPSFEVDKPEEAYDEARRAAPLVQFSAAMREQSAVLKRFLFANLYRHPQVIDTTAQGRQVVRELFDAYRQRPGELRPSFAGRADRERAVADYIAGMTDRFALREHERLTGRRLWP